jgi:NAD(P)-dependent dehydrogenase (short-subunit alcohol dehydrogenase family)
VSARPAFASEAAPGTAPAAFSLRGRTALVTGAAGLLGRRHCAALHAAGATVVAVDLDPEACAAAAAEAGERASAHAADVSDAASLRAARDAVLERFGRIDVLVNNAALNEKVEDGGGALALTRFEEFPLDAWERALRVNVTGVFLCCQVFGAEMARAGRGSIVNVASTYALVAPDPSLYVRPDGAPALYKSAAYPTTKAALLGLTRHLAAWWGGRGVRVNALSPGGVENGQEEWFVERYAARTPLGRMAGADDYAGALVFLASDASAYMTGANLVVDGGFTAW